MNGASARKLPRGHHGLTAEEVGADQLDRLLEAAIDLTGEIGYRRTTVAGLIKRAGISRATFYGFFDNRAGCFEAAHRRAIKQVDRALKQEDPVVGLVTLLAGRPPLTRLLFSAAPVAGPIPAKAYLAAIKRWSKRLADHLDSLYPASAETSHAADLERMALGGITGTLIRRVGKGVDPPDTGDLIFLVLLPRLGGEVAAATRDRYLERVVSST